MSTNKEKNVKDAEDTNAEMAAENLDNENNFEEELDDLIVDQQKKNQ